MGRFTERKQTRDSNYYINKGIIIAFGGDASSYWHTEGSEGTNWINTVAVLNALVISSRTLVKLEKNTNISNIYSCLLFSPCLFEGVL